MWTKGSVRGRCVVGGEEGGQVERSKSDECWGRVCLYHTFVGDCQLSTAPNDRGPTASTLLVVVTMTRE